jgi:hypothetical protein
MSQRPRYSIERHSDGTARVTGEIEFSSPDAWTVDVELPTFEEQPNIEFVRSKNAENKPQVKTRSKVSFTASVQQGSSFGRWTWIATGRLKS